MSRHFTQDDLYQIKELCVLLHLIYHWHNPESNLDLTKKFEVIQYTVALSKISHINEIVLANDPANDILAAVLFSLSERPA